MRPATYNVENLFERRLAMNKDSWEVGKEALAAYSKFNSLAQKSKYNASEQP